MAFEGVARQIEDANGVPVAGARIEFKLAGTSTDATAYTDAARTSPATNPLIADSAGYFVAYLDPTINYDITAKSADEGTTYQSWTVNATGSDYQPTDATLTALAGLSTADGQAIRARGADSFEVYYPEVDTLAALKALNGADQEDGQVIWMRGGTSALDGKEGNFVYDAGSTATANDAVIVAPADNIGRFIRQEWYLYTDIHARWWGLTLNDDTAGTANGTALTTMFAWIEASSQSGDCYFPQGIIYVSMPSSITITKVRGWKFHGTSDAGVANGSGTRFYLQGGGMTYFIVYRTCIQFHWERCLFLIDGSGISGIFDVGADDYYEVDGVTVEDSSAISSYLCEWKNCTFTANVGGGYGPSLALMYIHSAVTLKITGCWFVAANTALFLGAAGSTSGDADFRTIAKGTAGQITVEDTLIDGDIIVRKLSTLLVQGGQITKQSGVGASTAAARFAASSLDLCNGVTFDNVGGFGFGGDTSAPFISASMIIDGLTVTPSCIIGRYSYFAIAGGASNNWNVSPTWSTVATDYLSATGILQIQASCTGKNLRSDSTVHGTVPNVVDDLRTYQDAPVKALFRDVTQDFGSISSGSTDVAYITLTGAVPGLPCTAGLSTAVAGIHFLATCYTANTVEVRCINYSGGAIDPASGTLRVMQFIEEI